MNAALEAAIYFIVGCKTFSFFRKFPRNATVILRKTIKVKKKMWSALKSDLLDFVNTIQADTTNTLQKVLGDDEEQVEMIYV